MALRLGAFQDLDELIGDLAMRFTVHGAGVLFAGRLHQAKDLACGFVEPVLEILHAISGLDFQVGCMRTRDRLGCQIFYVLVNIHVDRNTSSSWSAPGKSPIRHNA